MNSSNLLTVSSEVIRIDALGNLAIGVSNRNKDWSIIKDFEDRFSVSLTIEMIEEMLEDFKVKKPHEFI